MNFDDWRGVILLIGSYVLGSIPFAYLVTRWKSGKDIRELGSGNAGATNVARTMGRLPGLIVLGLDSAKGAAAVLMGRIVGGTDTWGAIAGFAAMLGHSYPVFLGFRGGKNVATGGGAFMVLSPLAILSSIFIFLITLTIIRVVAIGSVVAAASFPLSAWIFGAPAGVIAWGAVCALLIIIRHKQDLAESSQRGKSKTGSGDA